MRPVKLGIRLLHRILLSRRLPSRLSIYLHSVEGQGIPALRQMIAFFRDNSYRFFGLDDFIVESHARSVWLSFDDNYVSWYHLLDILSQESVCATFYTNTLPLSENVKGPDVEAYYDRICHSGSRIPLKRNELLAICQAGHTVGAHTHTHPNLAGISLQDAKTEILTNKQILEDITGRAVCHFAYPFGMRRFFSPQLRAICDELGFSTIANAIPAAQHCAFDTRNIYRSRWDLARTVSYNIADLRVDGSVFERLTGRSAIG